jgi:hypothetical protein
MTERRFVSDLPDLIDPAEYPDDPAGRRVRVRIRVGADGVEILGDAMNARALELLLEGLQPEAIEQMLCG